MPAQPRRRSKSATPKRAASARPIVRALTGTVFVTRQIHFNSAHRLENPTKSQQWNVNQYGLCTSPHWHGHNYVLEVTVAGTPDPVTGYVLDLGKLKDVLNRAIADKCDHKNLNTDVPFLRGVIPTTENLVIAFWNELGPLIPSGRLHRIRLYETPRNFAEYFGPAASA
jgi:6-pyruvoyltetrahydropterin/6-carboxytetrahydropterin synthase